MSLKSFLWVVLIADSIMALPHCSSGAEDSLKGELSSGISASMSRFYDGAILMLERLCDCYVDAGIGDECPVDPNSMVEADNDISFSNQPEISECDVRVYELQRNPTDLTLNCFGMALGQVFAYGSQFDTCDAVAGYVNDGQVWEDAALEFKVCNPDYCRQYLDIHKVINDEGLSECVSFYDELLSSKMYDECD